MASDSRANFAAVEPPRHRSRWPHRRPTPHTSSTGIASSHASRSGWPKKQTAGSPPPFIWALAYSLAAFASVIVSATETRTGIPVHRRTRSRTRCARSSIRSRTSSRLRPAVGRTRNASSML